ncbi:multisite-specific tRNA:(cytosine-C(5))-methyltransferase-like isoform X2 [Telopea speciosissima]|uniref:multisite-specific tRNA:(cytosine-C(5))-methyltransferase-like isoform X2 n=1 Tax=Telopea speciosissima TaxID=54955 RepID=UPI001CC510D2|nr:multisite-specific tRNA:(cytosine-C(5))-methyltransferase-like isoform X2 [Telopea speciosissima]
MGGNRGRTQRKHFRKSRENVWKKDRSDNPSSEKSSWEPFATQNLDFEEYYKGQGIVPQEEWDVFMEILRKPLPASFRINSSGQFFKDIRSQLENDFMKSFEAEVPDGELEPIRPLPWYPENLGWHSNFSRMQLRKNQTLERFHEFLKQENEIGNITRQEAVSMVPPLFLDVHRHHFVLDMCAAPGSKTFQLLEIIHQSTEPGLLPDGMVIANDADTQRCNLLIHQTKRMCSANLIVTNHEAQHFPSCHSNKNCLDISETESFKDPMISQLLFDSVLCDVPCSGDGTLRKAPDIWRKWNAGMGNGVHRLQVQIAMRGIQLLKVGGRMVYSTCSMNPVENEAVVAEILRRCGGSVELLDVSTELPQLVRRPGLKKWKVRDKGIWLASYKDVPRYRRGAIVPSMFPSGSSSDTGNAPSDGLQEDTGPLEDLDMGNSPSSVKRLKNGGNIDCGEGLGQLENFVIPTVVSDDEVSSLPLERCMRILPHDQNTGAFFIAVFHKLSPLSATLENQGQLTSGNMELPKKLADELIEDTNELEINPSEDGGGHLYSEVTSDADLPDKQPEEGALEPDSNGICEEKEPEESNIHGDGETSLESSKNVKRKLQIQGKWRGVDPVVFFRDETIISSIKAFYGVNESFALDGHLVTRNLDTHHVKRIYYISKSVQGVLNLNFLAGQRLKIASVGLKTFERQTSREGTSTECAFRISSEGLPLLLPYITKQILCASLVDFKHLLQYKTIKFADFVDAEFGEKASKLKLGCCIFVLRKESEGTSDPVRVDASTIAIGCWKGKSNISVMVSTIDCQELLQRLSLQSGNERGSLAQENKHSSLEVDGTEPTDDLDVNQEPGTIEQVPIS